VIGGKSGVVLTRMALSRFGDKRDVQIVGGESRGYNSALNGHQRVMQVSIHVR